MATRTSIHKRSRSDPVPRKSLKNNKSNIHQFHMIDLLFQEDEIESILERKLFLEDPTNEYSISKEAKKLLKEIAGLELQVIYLERYLLSLYRTFFNNKSDVIEKEEKPQHRSPKTAVSSPRKDLEDSGIFRSHSSLSHCSGYSFKMSPQAMDSYHHSLPFSMLEQADIDAMIGQSLSKNVTKSPNSLSEEMITCISEVFRELADQELLEDRESSSPFHGKERVTRPYDMLLMVKSLCKDSEKLNEVEPTLRHFRSLVHKLEEVNPKKLNHEEKLAFWINIHNSLVMHAILVYGNTKNSTKRVSGLLKAAYNIGGRSLNLDTIQTSILRCQVSRPGQIFRFFFPSRTKGKAGDLSKDYAITKSEPLLHFALCLGNFSDPKVGVYTPKNVMMELECGREEYIRSNVGISKEKKILLPKLVESYVKDSDLCHVSVFDMIRNSLPCEARNGIQECRNKKHGRFSIDWIPHDFRFRLLL